MTMVIKMAIYLCFLDCEQCYMAVKEPCQILNHLKDITLSK